MLSKLSLLILLLLPVISFAQRDTTFFNGNRKVRTLREAEYYRLPLVRTGNRYQVAEYYKNGNLKTEGYRNAGTMAWDGPYVSYYPNGSKEYDGNYMNGHKVANWKYYREDPSRLWVISSYPPSIDTIEILTSFYKSGKAKRVEYRVKNQNPVGACYAEDGAEIPFTPFEKMPEFKGDITAFLAQSLRYPLKARAKSYQGNVNVRFTVLEDGRVTGIAATDSSSHISLIQEAVRVVKLTGSRWNPGTIDDAPVKTYYTLPVNFSMEK
jgi:TonB family protein